MPDTNGAPGPIGPEQQLCAALGRRDGFQELYLDVLDFFDSTTRNFTLTRTMVERYRAYNERRDEWEFPPDVLLIEHGVWYYRQGYRSGYGDGISMLETLLRGKQEASISWAAVEGMIRAFNKAIYTIIIPELTAAPMVDYSSEAQARHHAMHSVVESVSEYMFDRARQMHAWATFGRDLIEQMRWFHLNRVQEQFDAHRDEVSPEFEAAVISGVNHAFDVLITMTPVGAGLTFEPAVVEAWTDKLGLLGVKYGPEKPEPEPEPIDFSNVRQIAVGIPRAMLERLIAAGVDVQELANRIAGSAMGGGMGGIEVPHSQTVCKLADGTACCPCGITCTVCGGCHEHHNDAGPPQPHVFKGPIIVDPRRGGKDGFAA